MKTKLAAVCSLFGLCGLFLSSNFALHAQSGPGNLIPVTSLPGAGGSYWSLQKTNWPPFPADPYPTLPLFTDGNGNYFYNDLDLDYTALWSAVGQPNQTGGLIVGGAMLAGGVPQPGGTNSGSGGAGTNMPLPKYGPNDLYLTNFAVSGPTNTMVIHPPSGFTNGVYNLLYTTSLSPPISWQWLMTTTPGQTNLTVINATDPQRFYGLGATNSSAGTDIWVAFMDTFDTGLPGSYYTLYISAQESCTGVVTIPIYSDDFYNGPTYNFVTTNFSLAAGTMTNITIQEDSTIPDDDDLVRLGIHITASQPVSVYGLCYYVAASWAFTGWPTPMLGTNYCVLARPSFSVDQFGEQGYSQFAILGTASNTTVTILPSATANLATNTGSNTLFTIILQPGSTYQIESLNNTNDVTGTWITSDKPIAVFAGASIADVPNENTAAGNPLVQELLPVSSWGNQALSRSFGRPGGDSYRVLSATNAAVVITTTNGALTTNLVGGQPYDFILDGPVEFQANNAIQVAQFALGGFTNNGTGDPCEILLPSTGHYLTSYTIAVGTNDGVTGDFDTNFLNLIIPQSAILTTVMDGASITNFVALANFEQVGSSGYSAARIPVAQGTTHRISSSQPIEVQVYGFSVFNESDQLGAWDAYSYLAGLVIFP
jgi:hypothetical protein